MDDLLLLHGRSSLTARGDAGIRGAIYAPKPFNHNSINRTDYKPFVIDAGEVLKSKADRLAKVRELLE